MDGLVRGKFLTGILEKYKYPLAVVLVGVVLLLLPGQDAEIQKQPEESIPQQESLEQQLEAALSRIEGAGSVEVVLTRQTGEETFYQTDTEENKNADNTSSQSQTVIVSDQERNETGLVRRTDPPRYLGALIVCQGADSARVRLAIVEAVSCVTGLNANQISVLKMK